MCLRALIGLWLTLLTTLPLAALCQDLPPLPSDSIPHQLLHDYDSVAAQLNARIDSLSTMELPTDAYARHLDSLYAAFTTRDLAELHKAYGSGPDKVDARLARLDSIVTRRRATLDSLMHAGGLPSQMNLSIPNADAVAKHLNILPHMPTLPTANIPNLSVPAVNSPISQAPTIAMPGELNAIQDLSGQAGELSGKLGEAGTVAENINTGNISTAADKLTDQQARRLAATSGLTDAVSAGEAAKSAVLTKPNLSTDAAQAQAKKAFVDHFAGKEALVQNDMESISKVQMKYRTVNDSRQLPKHVPNAMKGKPFRERLIPGISVQLLTANHASLDIAPSIGYKLSGRLRTGIAAYRRLSYFKQSRSIRTEDVTGFRLYGELKIKDQLYVHIEPELFRDRRPNAVPPGNDVPGTWQRRLNLGILKTYTINPRWTGTVMILYDVLDLKNFPNTRGGGLRIGVEYKLKNKEKK